MRSDLCKRHVRVLEMFEQGLTRLQVRNAARLTQSSLNTVMCEIRAITEQDIPGDGARIQQARGSVPKMTRDERTAMRDAEIIEMFERGMTREDVMRELVLSPVGLASRLTSIRKRRGGVDLPGAASDARASDRRSSSRKPKAPLSHEDLETMFAAGATFEQVRVQTGYAPNSLKMRISEARRGLGRDLPGHGARAKGGKPPAHPTHPRERARQNYSSANDDAETRSEADARVRRDIAAGKRCARCHLELPCLHEQIRESAALKRECAGPGIDLPI